MTVDERPQWLRAQAARSRASRRSTRTSPGYYAVFFYDPDGLKLEIVHVPGLVAA